MITELLCCPICCEHIGEIPAETLMMICGHGNAKPMPEGLKITPSGNYYGGDCKPEPKKWRQSTMRECMDYYEHYGEDTEGKPIPIGADGPSVGSEIIALRQGFAVACGLVWRKGNTATEFGDLYHPYITWWIYE